MALFLGVAFAGDVPTCGEVRCAGKRIHGNLRVISLCVPRGMRIEETFGEHGEVHAVVYYRGAALWLTSGLWFSAKRPEEFGEEWTARTWRSPDGERNEYRRRVAGKHSRYVTLIPNGWVEYAEVNEATAKALDRVLDSICWKPWKN